MEEIDDFSMDHLIGIDEDAAAKEFNQIIFYNLIVDELVVPSVFLESYGAMPSLCCDEGLMRGLFRTSVARAGFGVRYGRGHSPSAQEWCMTFDGEEQKFSEQLVEAKRGGLQITGERGSYDLTVEVSDKLIYVELKALSDTGGKGGNLDTAGLAKDATRLVDWEHARMFVLCDEGLFSRTNRPWPIDKLRLNSPAQMKDATDVVASQPTLSWTDDVEVGVPMIIDKIHWQVAKVLWPERAHLWGMVAAAIIPIDQASNSQGPAHRVALWACHIDTTANP